VIEIIDQLLAVADPEGENATRLRRWRADIEAGIFLGPGPRSYIQKLVTAIDNIECRWLDSTGVCVSIYAGAHCTHAKPGGHYAKCHGFMPRRDGKGTAVL
jgi:hypothetical protein